MTADWKIRMLEAKNRSTTEKPTFRRRRNAQGTCRPWTSEDSLWSQVFQRYVETPLFKKSSECVLSEIPSIKPIKKKIYLDGQVDRQVFYERFLDGNVADVHFERRAKTQPVFYQRDSGEH